MQPLTRRCVVPSEALRRWGRCSVGLLDLADGRELAYDTYGEPDGVPVIFSHGFSDSRLIRNPDEELTASLGVFVIAADQPGVGGSTPAEGRRMVDWGDGHGAAGRRAGPRAGSRSPVTPAAGPTPSRSPCRMPDRVTQGALASPVGPFDQDGLRQDAGDEGPQAGRQAAPPPPRHPLGLPGRPRRRPRRTSATFVEAMAEDDASDAGHVPGRPRPEGDVRGQLHRRDGPGRGGRLRDDDGPLGLGLRARGHHPALRRLLRRRRRHHLAPRCRRHVAERLPDCEAHVWPGAGHYAFVDRDRWTEFLGSLAA